MSELDLLREITSLRTRLAAAEEQLRYPDDPAHSIAAMLARMSPEDKQAFNFCVKEAAAAARRALEELQAAIANEEEMDGPMPDDLWERCATREGAAEVMRAAIRAMKRALLAPERPRCSNPRHWDEPHPCPMCAAERPKEKEH